MRIKPHCTTARPQAVCDAFSFTIPDRQLQFQPYLALVMSDATPVIKSNMAEPRNDPILKDNILITLDGEHLVERP